MGEDAGVPEAHLEALGDWELQGVQVPGRSCSCQFSGG